MKKKAGLTIVEQAMVLVPEFKARALKLEHQVELRGQSASTLNNYIRRIALFVIHFEKLPEHVSEDEINEYLVALARDPRSPSRSSFKHMVYGLRYYYRLLGMNEQKGYCFALIITGHQVAGCIEPSGVKNAIFGTYIA